jgi:hypothetical protein
MPAPSLPSTISLEAIRDELVWSKLACGSNKYAKDQAPMFAGLLTQWPGVYTEQLAHWDAQTSAQFNIWRVDGRIGLRIDSFNVVLLTAVNQDRADPHYKLYMTDAPSKLKKPVLGSELETVRGWVPMLQEESNASLKAFAAKFAKDVADGDAANEQATEADAANTQFRTVGGLSQFLADVTKVRDEVFVALDKIRTANPSLPKDFAKSFFRATTKAETPEEVQTKLAARQKAKADAVKRKADLKAAQTQMKALKKQITGLKK